jgi:hypothetical protein
MTEGVKGVDVPQAGTWRIIAVADAGKSVAESNEENNTGSLRVADLQQPCSFRAHTFTVQRRPSPMKMNLLTPTILAIALVSVAAPAAAWWKCPDGMNLGTRTINNVLQARCYKPAQTLSQSVSTACPFGSSFVQDFYSGGADACVAKDPTGTAQSAVPYQSCPGGYTHNKISGRDTCTKVIPAVESMVNLKV